MRKLLCASLAFVALAGAALAVEPEERLDDPVLEARARAISRELRCVVCAGEVIDDSNADIARDLRILVRDRLKAGDTDQEVREYVVERYGEYVLMRPPFSARNAALWAAPFVLLIGAGALAAYFIRGRRSEASAVAAAAPLSPDEEAALARLLKEEPAGRA